MTRRTSQGIFSLSILVASALALSACGGAQARKAKHLEKGEAYLAAGNFEKARVEVQNALQIAPTDAEARFQMGVIFEKLGKIREAAQYYQGTIDLQPDHLGARTNLARLYILSAVPERAMENLKPALEKHPDDAELLALRAAVYVQQKDMEKAEVDAERAVKLDPKNTDAVATLAGIYTAGKALDRAQQLLEGTIVRLPDSVDLRMILAQVYMGENRPADAEAQMIELIKLKPQEKGHRLRLAQFYARQDKADAAEQTLRDGIKALPEDREMKIALVDFLAARRSPEAAEQELKTMIAANSKDFELQFALGKFYEAGGKVDLAVEVYQGVIKSEGLNAPGLAARDRLADLRVRQKDLPAAQQLIGEVLAKSPRDDDALTLRGNIALSKQDPKGAIADLRAVLRDQPNSIPVLRTLARAHLANHEPAIAEETIRRAVDANPTDLDVRLDLALMLAQMGKPEQAKPLLVDLVKLQPGNIPALTALFKVSAALNDTNTARQAADALVATQPKAAIGYMYEGLLAQNDKKPEEALRFFERATSAQPDALEPIEAQVRLLVEMKRIPDALRHLDAIAAAAPAAPFALNIKGDLLAVLNRGPEAEEAYKAASARAPKWWAPYRGLANLQFAAKNPDGAVAILRKGQATVDQPEYMGIELGGYFEHAGKIDDAIHEYEEVLHRNPQMEAASNNLAMLLATYRTDAASLDRAKTLAAQFANSSNLSFLDTYGWVLYKHGEAAASVPVLERVVAKAPNAAEAHYHLGMALATAGDPAAARDNLTKAIDSGAKFSGLDEAKTTLQKLSQQPTDGAPKT